MVATYSFFLGTVQCIPQFIGLGWPLRWENLPRVVNQYSMFFASVIILLGLRYSEKRSPLCTRCGYLLGGLTEPRCPECGRVYTLDEFYQL